MFYWVIVVAVAEKRFSPSAVELVRHGQGNDERDPAMRNWEGRGYLLCQTLVRELNCSLYVRGCLAWWFVSFNSTSRGQTWCSFQVPTVESNFRFKSHWSNFLQQRWLRLKLKTRQWTERTKVRVDYCHKPCDEKKHSILDASNHDARFFFFFWEKAERCRSACLSCCHRPDPPGLKLFECCDWIIVKLNSDIEFAYSDFDEVIKDKTLQFLLSIAQWRWCTWNLGK